jgi:hypothetical protein
MLCDDPDPFFEKKKREKKSGNSQTSTPGGTDSAMTGATGE